MEDEFPERREINRFRLSIFPIVTQFTLRGQASSRF
jgi:hypothetical protein